jgi:hypothetical protein
VRIPSHFRPWLFYIPSARFGVCYVCFNTRLTRLTSHLHQAANYPYRWHKRKVPQSMSCKTTRLRTGFEPSQLETAPMSPIAPSQPRLVYDRQITAARLTRLVGTQSDMFAGKHGTRNSYMYCIMGNHGKARDKGCFSLTSSLEH